jgi:hypothetical protein
MPKKLERCVKKVKKKGSGKDAWAICVKSTGIKKKKGGGWTKGKKTKKTTKRRGRKG